MTITTEKRLLQAQHATLHDGTHDGEPARVWTVVPAGAGPAACDAAQRDLGLLQALPGDHPLHVRAVERLDDGTLQVAVPRPDGDRGLKAMLAMRGALASTQALSLARGLCAGLAALHQQGLVHGGLTPALVRFPHDTASDAGADPTLLGAGWSALRVAWVVRGEADPDVLRYLAPEMLRGQAARPDRQADLHSVGCLLYEALTGAPVFPGEDAEALREAILRPERPDLRAQLGPAEEPLARVLGRCLHAEPDRRYASATALWRELAPALGGRATPLPAHHDPGGPASSPPGADQPLQPAPAPPRPSPRPRRRGPDPVRWTTGLTIIGVAVALILLFANSRRNRPTTDEPPPPSPMRSATPGLPATAMTPASMPAGIDAGPEHRVPPAVAVDPRTARLRGALTRVGLAEDEVVISALLRRLFDRAALALRAQDYRAFDAAMRPLELATRRSQCGKIRQLKRNYIIGGIRELGPLLSKWERFRLERMLADAAELKGDCRTRNEVLRPLVLEIRDRLAFKHARGL